MAELKIGVRVDACMSGNSSADNLSAATLRRTLGWVASTGATSVELCGRGLFNVSELSDTAVRTLRKILDDLNLTVASIRFPTQHGFDHLPNLDRRVDATKAAMRAAYRLGAPLVVNQIGHVPAPPDKHPTSGSSQLVAKPSPILGLASPATALPPEGLSVAEAQAWVAGASAQGEQATSDTESTHVDPRWETMRQVLDDLGRYGAKVGAFFAAETGTEPGSHLASLVDMSAESYVAVALNPGQLIINRHSVSEAIAALGERIQIVNAVDGVLDLSAGRGVAVPIGQGTADFPSLIGQLEDLPYRGPFIIGRAQMPAATALQEIAASVEYLRNL